MTVSDTQEALTRLQGQTPLALYVFSRSAKFIDEVRSNSQSGAIVVNDTLLHFGVEELPFGGIGQSGMGSYHGRKSFDTFTHERASLKTPFWYVVKHLGCGSCLPSDRVVRYIGRNSCLQSDTSLIPIGTFLFFVPHSSKRSTSHARKAHHQLLELSLLPRKRVR